MDAVSNSEQNADSVVSSSTAASSSSAENCPHSNVLRLKVKQLTTQEENLRHTIGQITLAIQRMADRLGDSCELLPVALNDFQQVVVKTDNEKEPTLDQFSGHHDDAPCKCSTCQALLRQKFLREGELQYIRQEIENRIQDYEVLVADESDKLVSILVHRVKRVAERVMAGDFEGPCLKKPKIEIESDNSLPSTPTKNNKILPNESNSIHVDSTIDVVDPLTPSRRQREKSGEIPASPEPMQSSLSRSSSSSSSSSSLLILNETNEVASSSSAFLTNHLQQEEDEEEIMIIEESSNFLGEEEETQILNESLERQQQQQQQHWGNRIKIEYQPEDDDLIDIGPVVKMEDGYNAISYLDSPTINVSDVRGVGNMESMGSGLLQLSQADSGSQPGVIEEFDPLEQSMEETVLSDSKLLRKIIQALDFVELKTARLVDSNWRKISTEVLLESDLGTVVIQYDTNMNTFRQSSWVEWLWGPSRCQSVPWDKPLGELNDLLTTPNFPCSCFAISHGDLGAPEVQNLFQIAGLRMKQLFLKTNPMVRSTAATLSTKEATKKFTTKETFTKILQHSVLPNLKYLEIRNFEYTWKNTEQLCLPSLNYFSFVGCHKTAGAILRGSPNLPEVADPIGDYDRVKLLSQSGKMHLVKKISCDEDTFLRSLALIINASPLPRLDLLKFLIDKKYMHFSSSRKKQLANYFNILLNSSKDTIEDLYLSGLFPCSQLQYPVLAKLEYLDLDWDRCAHATACFPPGINLATTFPNLHVLDVSTLHCSRDVDWTAHFPSDTVKGNLPNIETLHIPDNCSEFWMTRLHGLCPNFKTLIILGEWGMPIVLPKVFKLWRHLESIDLQIFKLDNPGKKRFYLDPAFTGMSEEVCITRLQFPDEPLEEHPIGPSIRDLKVLKRLWISFTCPHVDLARVAQNSLPVTRVSGLYAFSKMPKLKVSIWYDQNCLYTRDVEAALESIAPFANFLHKHQHQNNKITPTRLYK